MFFGVLLMTMLCAQAKEYVVVLKGEKPASIGNTEVVSRESGLTDTLTVKPGKDVSTIYICLTDERGETYDYRCVSASYDDRISLITPSLPEGYVLNIYDDKGYVYMTELE